MKKLLKIIGSILFGALFVWVSAQLFFQRETDAFLTSLFSEKLEGVDNFQVLNVMYPDEAFTLEPTSFNPSVRQRLLNIYEPLVFTDKDLNFIPVLALSFGRISDTEWRFKLRPDVNFHDGSEFNADDVIFSFKRVKEFEGSDLKHIFDSVEFVKKVNEFEIAVITRYPDPLLLQKVSTVLVVPEEFNEQPAGTGPYKLKSWQKGEQMILEAFEGHWASGGAKFREVRLFVGKSKSDRVNRLLTGEVDLLLGVPHDATDVIENSGLNLISVPGLEVQFLVFNHDSKVFNVLENRKSFSSVVDVAGFAQKIGKFAKPMSQYVSNGVFGFNKDIKIDNEKVKDVGFAGVTVKLHLPIGLDVLGEHVRTKFKEAGVNVVVSYLEMDRLSESFEKGDADIYFLGYRSESGDSAEFFETIVQSNGEYNVGNFYSEEIDTLVEKARSELDSRKRLSILHELMLKVVDVYFGVPLIEYQQAYAFNNKLIFEPRIDGYLLFDELDKR